MSEDLQEKPAFCDIPGGPKDPNLKARCAEPDNKPAAAPNPADIRSKALTDTEKKRKKIRDLGLTHEKKVEKESFKQIKDRITSEANLNDYVKKYNMKMGNKTSTVDKDAWVDGIGGLSKREAKTLKRRLQGNTREGMKESIQRAVDEYVGTTEYKKRMKEKGYKSHKKDKYSGWVEDIKESKELQAKMALDDAKIKYKVEDGKLYVDKKDVMKAEKALAKSFKTKPSSLDGKKYPAVYYHGGSLGIWNKKRPITGMGRR